MSNYHPTEVEQKWLKIWQKADFNRAQDFDSKPKCYALVEFPYPSGEGLHIGHAFTNTIMDVYARKKRMEGFNVLQPMGWDAFGLPTENSAIKLGIHPAKLTARNTKSFKELDQRLAISYDWLREIDTTDPNYYKWTQWIFIQMFKYGLAYKQETSVGWCPSCKIILANEEIVGGKCERCGHPAEYRRQKQWLLRITAYADRLSDELDLVDYPFYVKKSQRDWIGRTKGIEIDYPVVLNYGKPHPKVNKISCYSTRPDTNFGATFVVIAPEHPLVKKLTTAENQKSVSKYVENAKRKSEMERTELAKVKTGVFTGSFALNRLNDKLMPIYVSDFVVLTAGTGIVVGVPAHDERDFAFAKKYSLEIIPVIKPKKGQWDYSKTPFTDIDDALVFNSGFLDGLPALKAKEKIIGYLVKKDWGRQAKNYHLRDWIFSRQHYWGEPIPMTFCPECAKKKITWWDTREGKAFMENSKFEILNSKQTLNSKSKTIEQKRFEHSNFGDLKLFRNLKLEIRNFKRSLVGWFPVAENELPLKLPEVEKYQPTDTGESPLANIKEWVQTKCPNCGSEAKRETDTMPNWAGSSWYFLRYCDPQNSKLLAQRSKLNYWLPIDVYLGGAEHTTLHLLYSRFWHKFLNDINQVPGSEPYAARRQHGVILGEDGSRMSKSRGNIVNPGEVVEKFGADTLRVYLMFMGPYESTMPWDTKGVEGSYRFLCRVWRLCQEHTSEGVEELTRKLHQTIKKVSEDIDNLKHNTAIAALMEFINEWSKIGSISAKDANIFLQILAPFAPFIAEELYSQLNARRYPLDAKFSIHSQTWPKFDPKLVEEEMITIIIQVNGKLRGQIQVGRQGAKGRELIEKLAKENIQVAKYLDNQKIKKTIYVSGKLINFVT